ncbi:MAG: hypothetical protein JWN86_659 [Planctomycetota bacterium]|nr:hypothetical protein [Planctomycetota bacterium]
MKSFPRTHQLAVSLGLVTVSVLISAVMADTVTLKNGIVYRGSVDRDNTLVSIFDPDGIKRVILRDTKILKSASDEGTAKAEHFQIVQPLTKHAGEMPTAATDIKAGAWDKAGRRSFRYSFPRRSKSNELSQAVIEMSQAIIDLGPRVCKIRGIDGFWVSQVATSTVPKSVVLDILGKVEQKNLNERFRVCRFLIQAEMYPEARAEVVRLGKDFRADPDVADKAKNALALIQDSEARDLLVEIETRRKAPQPRAVLSKLKTFPSDGVPADIIASVRDQIRKDERQAAADKALAESVRRAAEGAKIEDKARLIEILDGLAEAPDAVRGRLDAFEKGLAEGAKPDALYALALSGFVAGGDAAIPDLKSAESMFQARDLARKYLSSLGTAPEVRAESLSKLREIQVDGKAITLATLCEIIRRMPPPLRDAQAEAPGKPTLLRVRDDPNPEQPSEYAVILPPEYSPLRSYPMVVALHSSETPSEALSWWSAQAALRGFIVIAPEYNLRDQRRDYRYSESEHAAVELVLRDALRRFAVDSDRVFLGGSLFGGNMAWDFGLAHPDLFAGVAVISGLPAKYVWSNKANAPRVPFYVAMGDLAPAETDVIFGIFAKPLIAGNKDMTYVEYYRRGLEDLPEEASSVFDWMSARRRETYPKSFDVVANRNCDDRYYGIVVKEFAKGRTKDPAAVDNLGKNLNNPAKIGFQAKGANLLNLTTSGVVKLDVWVSPKFTDFEKRMEIRINNKTVFKGMPNADLESLLEDLRIRGDRSQVFWMRVQATLGNGRN